MAYRAYRPWRFESAPPPQNVAHATPRSAFSPSQWVESFTRNDVAGPAVSFRHANHPALLLQELGLAKIDSTGPHTPGYAFFARSSRSTGSKRIVAWGFSVADASVVASPPALWPSSPTRVGSILSFAGVSAVASVVARDWMMSRFFAGSGENGLGKSGAATTNP